MGKWGNGPFENDGGLDMAFEVLDHLITRLEQVARGTGGDRSSIICDEQELAATVELLRLVSETVYRPSLFAPIRGLPLPDPGVIAGWRDEFLARYARLAPEQLEATPAELGCMALEAATPLARLAELSRQQSEASEATHHEVWAEVEAAHQAGAAQGGHSDARGPDRE